MKKMPMTREDFRNKATILINKGHKFTYVALALAQRSDLILKSDRGVDDIKEFIDSHFSVSGTRDVYKFVRGLAPYKLKAKPERPSNGVYFIDTSKYNQTPNIQRLNDNKI